MSERVHVTEKGPGLCKLQTSFAQKIVEILVLHRCPQFLIPLFVFTGLNSIRPILPLLPVYFVWISYLLFGVPDSLACGICDAILVYHIRRHHLWHCLKLNE